ncbi:unnamed protein product [Rotaria sp. Silwood2]|nr:unnamed protein product [Rotaria sp. Silwood2]CAF4343992.1 unnamed protein product [Rotaria sp. Silwood2]
MDRCQIWKFLLITGIILSLVAFILGWIGFGVPDWHSFQLYTNSIVEFYGLWAYCQEQVTTFGTVCNSWSTAENILFGGSRPHFIRTSEGLITVGMILLSLGLAIAVLATILPLIAYLAGLFALISFIFLVIGLPIFGRESNNLSIAQGDVVYNKRYGFWLMVPTIVLEFLSILFFLAAAFLYQRCGYGNIFSGASKKVTGGKKKLGPYNVLPGPSYVNAPYGMRPPAANVPYGMGPPAGLGNNVIGPDPYPDWSYPSQAMPTLLSQYLTQQVPRSSGHLVARIVSVSSLPQPSITRAISALPAPNVAPDYYRMSEPTGPPFRPIINLTGQTLVGPLIRTR